MKTKGFRFIIGTVIILVLFIALSAYSQRERQNYNSFGVDMRQDNYVRSVEEIEKNIGIDIKVPSKAVKDEVFEGAQYGSQENKSAVLYYSNKKNDGTYYLISISKGVTFIDFKENYDKWLTESVPAGTRNTGEVIEKDDLDFYYRETLTTTANGEQEKTFTSLIWFDDDIYYVLNPSVTLSKNELVDLATSFQ